MTNALHLEFHQAYLRYLTEHTPAALGLASALVDSYRKKISDEQALVNRTFVSPYTVAIKTAHLARARAFRYIMAVIRNARMSADPAMVAVWNALKAPILDRYPLSILGGDGQKATAQIRGLILDLRGDCRMQTTRLSIDSAIDALEAANEQFAGNYISRNTARAEYPVGVMLALRGEVDELYTIISAIVQGQANVSGGDAAQQAMTEECIALVGQQNSLVADWRLRMSLTKGRPDTPPASGKQDDDDHPSVSIIGSGDAGPAPSLPQLQAEA